MTILQRLKNLEQRQHQTHGIAGLADRMRRKRLAADGHADRTPEELRAALNAAKPGGLAERMLRKRLERWEEASA